MSRIRATDSPPVTDDSPVTIIPRIVTKPAGNPAIVKPVALPVYANSPYPKTVPLPPPTPSSQPPATPPATTPALEANVPAETPRASIDPTKIPGAGAPPGGADYGTQAGTYVPQVGTDLPPRGRVPVPKGDIVIGKRDEGMTKDLKPGTQEYNDWVAQHKKDQAKIAAMNNVIITAASIVGTPLAGAAVKLAMNEQAKYENDPETQRAFQIPPVPATAFTSPFGLSTVPPSPATSQGTAVNQTVSTDQGFWEWFKKWIYDLLGIKI